MNNKFIGTIMLIGAGLTAAIGSVGAQVANSMVLSAFHVAKMGGINPPGPADASPHWLVFVEVGILTVCGLFFLFGKNKSAD